MAGDAVRPRARRLAVKPGRRRRSCSSAGLSASGRGAAGFRHGLARDALYADVPWMRRRALHRAIAEALEAAGAPSREIATHWLGASDGSRARDALLRAAAEAEAVHAFRDGAEAGRKALDLWPDGEDSGPRAAALERYARCAELAGELAEATRAWRDLAELRTASRRAAAQRRLAAVLRAAGGTTARVRPPGAWRQRVSRRTARPADAAIELLAMANQQRIAARHGEADRARATRGRAGRRSWPARSAPARAGPRGHGAGQARRLRRAGLAAVRDALAVALDNDMTAVAADLYQRLSLDPLRVGGLPARRGGARDRPRALPDERRHRSRDRVRDVPGLRAARARRLGARGGDVPRDDRERHRRLGRRGAARSHPRRRGPPQLRAADADLLPSGRRAARVTTT